MAPQTIAPSAPRSELAVIGGALVSPSLLPDLCRMVSSADFYAHRPLFEAIEDRHRKGDPIDANVIASDVGGRVTDAVTVLSDAIVTYSSAEACLTHARTIGDLAAVRRIESIAVGTLGRIRDDHVTDPALLLDGLETDVAGVNLPNDPRPLRDVWVGADLLAADFPEPGWVIPGLLRETWRVLFVGLEGGGKALDVETPILTTKGWSTMGQLLPGDHVFGPDGRPTKVSWCSPVMTDRTCYAVRFDDSTEVIADADHLWRTVDYDGRQRGRWTHAVHTTDELRATLHARGGHTVNHAIECAEPPALADAVLPVDPYTLGAWLGDGDSAGGGFTSADQEIVDRIRSAGWEVTKRPRQYRWHIGKAKILAPAIDGRRDRDERIGRTQIGRRTRAMSFAGRLRNLDVLGNKHIPEPYLTGSVEQRVELLRGLMDTDGTVGNRGAGNGRGHGNAKVELSLSNERLARDALRLVWSLGIKASINANASTLNGRVVGTRWRITFQTDLPVFHLPRKLERQAPLRTRRARTRYVVAVEPVPSRPVRCIAVENDSHVFLAGHQLVPTHNSTMLRQMAVGAAVGQHPWSAETFDPVPAVIVDCENPASVVRDGLKMMSRQVMEADLTVMSRPGGIDIRSRRDRDELWRLFDQCRPKVCAMGPLYKLYRQERGESDEQAAIAAQNALDDLRVAFGCTLILETHAPKGSASGRELIPFGSSAWMRWPELGWKLVPCDDRGEPATRGRSVKLDRFRGDRVQIDLPTHFTRGRDWPWAAVWAKDGMYRRTA